MIGEESPYAALCRDFSRLAFQEDHYEYSSSFQEQNMIEVRILCSICLEYYQFLFSFFNHLRIRQHLNLNRIWSTRVNMIIFLAHILVSLFQ